jgi:hypothetical protein
MIEVIQLLQWNTNDYIPQFHILEHKHNTRETGSYACVNTENGQPWPGKDNVMNCKWSAVKAHVCMQNFHDKWHCLSNKYKTLHHSTYIKLCATRATNSTQNSVHR